MSGAPCHMTPIGLMQALGGLSYSEIREELQRRTGKSLPETRKLSDWKCGHRTTPRWVEEAVRAWLTDYLAGHVVIRDGFSLITGGGVQVIHPGQAGAYLTAAGIAEQALKAPSDFGGDEEAREMAMTIIRRIAASRLEMSHAK